MDRPRRSSPPASVDGAGDVHLWLRRARLRPPPVRRRLSTHGGPRPRLRQRRVHARRRAAAPLRRGRDADQRRALRVRLRGPQPRRLRPQLHPAGPVHLEPRRRRPDPRHGSLRLQHGRRVVRVLEVLHEHGDPGVDGGRLPGRRPGRVHARGRNVARPPARAPAGPALQRGHGHRRLRDAPRAHEQRPELPRLPRAVAELFALQGLGPDDGRDARGRAVVHVPGRLRGPRLRHDARSALRVRLQHDAPAEPRRAGRQGARAGRPRLGDVEAGALGHRLRRPRPRHVQQPGEHRRPGRPAARRAARE